MACDRGTGVRQRERGEMRGGAGGCSTFCMGKPVKQGGAGGVSRLDLPQTHHVVSSKAMYPSGSCTVRCPPEGRAGDTLVVTTLTPGEGFTLTVRARPGRLSDHSVSHSK